MIYFHGIWLENGSQEPILDSVYLFKNFVTYLTVKIHNKFSIVFVI